LPEKALWPEEQKQNENDKRNRILPFGGDVPHPEMLGQANQQPAKIRAENVAQGRWISSFSPTRLSTF
jgi:hypothetical protein